MNDHNTQYLTVTGVLHPDNRLVLEPGYLTSVPDSVTDEKDSTLEAHLFDDTGKMLLHYGVPFERPCADGVAVAERIVAGKIPFPKATRTIRFLLDGILIHELAVSARAPVVSLIWDPANGTEGDQRVSWKGEHLAGNELQYLLSYSHNDGKSWQPLSLPTADFERNVDFRRLPGGSHCRLRVLATDGANTTAALSEPFQRPTQPCYAMVLSPEDNASFDAGEVIRFQGQGYYLEEREPEFELLEWSSSLSGPLGHGSLLELSDLSPGSHEITLTVGREGRVGTTRVMLQVRRASHDSGDQ